MSRNYLRQRTSSVSTVVLRAPPTNNNNNNNNHVSRFVNAQRQLSAVSQIYLPNGADYYPQGRLPPTGPESQQPFILATLEEEEEDENLNGEPSRISIITRAYSPEDKEIDEEKQLTKTARRILFIIEPILGGFILFPMIALFWQCGWNLIATILKHSNGIQSENSAKYTWKILFIPYLIVQIILLLFYLCQNLIYNFLKKRSWIIENLLLKFHTFILSTCYIIQWKLLWTFWDEFISPEGYFELTLSLTALFAFVVFNGHLSDLICAPFLFSYDSIEYSIQFGCPLLTKDMKEWKINLLNYILYEIIVSNLSITTWRGFYHALDNYFYPNDVNMSIGLCFLIGYLLYFPLMYFQTYLEDLNMKYEFWTFVSINFPQFYRNIRHFLAFLSCVFIWHSYWLFYDTYISIFEEQFKTYLLLYFISFLVLSVLQTSSSLNGPLSHINDENNFFPIYPHCYVSIVQRKLSQMFFTKPSILDNDYEL